MGFWLFLIFIILPLMEIYTLIKVGGVLGAMTTIVLIILTALVGISIARAQGFTIWRNISSQLNSRQVPTRALWEGLLVLLAGALLVMPGFLTDTLGFLFLIPIFRRFFMRTLVRLWLQRRFAAQIRIIDGEYEIVNKDPGS